MKIIDLQLEPHHIPVLANWHHREWSYLSPNGTVEQRIERMQSHLTGDFIPSTFIAKGNGLLGSASIIDHDMDTRSDLSPCWPVSLFHWKTEAKGSAQN